MMIVLKNIWYEIRALFGIKEEVSGNARVSKVLDHFKSLTDELKTGMFEIKIELAENTAQQCLLKDRIDKLKSGNAVLGGQYSSATCLRRSLTELMGQEDNNDATTN